MKKRILLLSITLAILSFSSTQKNLVPHYIGNAHDTIGRSLAQSYCTMCHVFPAPDLLDKKTWTDNVLPNMGWRLGIRNGTDPFKDMVPEEKKIIQKLNIYPDQPMIQSEDWEKIVNYYQKNAPGALPQKDYSDIMEGHQFSSQAIYFQDKKYPKTTLLKYDSTNGKLIIGDGMNRLYIMNGNNDVESVWFTESPPVDIDFPPDQPMRLLNIGTFNPSDQKKGNLFSFDTLMTDPSIIPKLNIRDLGRPVEFTTGDLNLDGVEDVVICEFGNNRGELAWYDGFDPNKKHILSLEPGARKTVIEDMNGDGRPDIVALMAQAREGISIFYNLGNRVFSEETVLQFPPAYGVNYFELVDFNHDGHPDILLTNGDNWDYSNVEKYYHGVRVFENDGNNHFTEKYFFPLPGASKAVAYDFDGDGDLDIALAAFYSDKQPTDHNFIYLENKGNYEFQPFYFPDVKGRWLTMETGDFNHDGKEDIFLGTYIHNTRELTQLMLSGVADFPQILILKNEMKE